MKLRVREVSNYHGWAIKLLELDVPSDCQFLTDWLDEWLTHRLTDWLTYWLSMVTDWLADWMNNWLTVWLKNWLANWMTHCLSTDIRTEWLADWLTSKSTLAHVMADWLSVIFCCSLTIKKQKKKDKNCLLWMVELCCVIVDMILILEMCSYQALVWSVH